MMPINPHRILYWGKETNLSKALPNACLIASVFPCKKRILYDCTLYLPSLTLGRGTS